MDNALCYECQEDSECTGSAVCEIGACVECRGDDNCSQDAPFCAEQTLSCVQCFEDKDCTEEGAICALNTCRVLSTTKGSTPIQNPEVLKDAFKQGIASFGVSGDTNETLKDPAKLKKSAGKSIVKRAKKATKKLEDMLEEGAKKPEKKFAAGMKQAIKGYGKTAKYFAKPEKDAEQGKLFYSLQMFKCCTDLSKKGGKFKKNATLIYDSLGANERTALIEQYIEISGDSSVEGQTNMTKFIGQYAQMMLAADEDF